MYEKPIPLERATHRRIFSPLAYSTVLNALVVPIVHREALRLASWFPTAWRMTEAGPELVVVRALVRNPKVTTTPQDLVTLPLILQAYPFLLDRAKSTATELAVLYDTSIAEEPNDIGAPVLTPDGKVSRGAEFRFRALKVFARHLPTSEAISEMLSRLDLFEPWPLSFEVAGQTIGHSNLFVVRPAIFGKGALAPVIARFGVEAASLLGAHRLSLFRAGPLLAAARTMFGVPETPVVPAENLMNLPADISAAELDHALRGLE